MANIERRTPRRELEKRAYRLGLATAVTGVATIVVVALALFTNVSFFLAFLLALLTAGFGYGFKRTVS